MVETSTQTVTLNTAQVRRLIDIGRRWKALTELPQPVRVMVDSRWATPLKEAELDLLQAVTTLIKFLQPAVPNLQPRDLGDLFDEELSMPFGQKEADALGELARNALLTSRRLRPLLQEVPEESVTFWDARKIVDRLAYDASDLLSDYVRLVNPVLASQVYRETAGE